MLKIKLLTILIGVVSLSLIFMPKVQAVSILGQSCTGSDSTSAVCQDGNTNANAPNPIFGPSGILTSATQLIAYIVGIASVVIIIISGFRMVISGGDSNRVSSARSALIYALIGLAIAISAQVIVVFVLQKV